MMALWRRPHFAILALLALLALQLPSLAWACPVMGRSTAAETVCRPAANSDNSATLMPCCAHTPSMRHAPCCAPTSQLPGDSNKDTFLTLPHADSRSILAQLAQAAHTGVDTAIAYPPTPLDVELPHACNQRDIALDSPFAFQNAPPLTAGRAPPLL
jgi:hypothetical protein